MGDWCTKKQVLGSEWAAAMKQMLEYLISVMKNVYGIQHSERFWGAGKHCYPANHTQPTPFLEGHQVGAARTQGNWTRFTSGMVSMPCRTTKLEGRGRFVWMRRAASSTSLSWFSLFLSWLMFSFWVVSWRITLPNKWAQNTEGGQCGTQDEEVWHWQDQLWGVLLLLVWYE